MRGRSRSRSAGAPGVSPWPFAGMAGMAAALFLYGASGLVAPWWAVMVLVAFWFVLFVVALRWWSRRPRWVPLLPVLAVVVWFAALNAGAYWLGWTA